MARTMLNKKTIRAPWGKTANTSTYAKLAEHDLALDQLAIAISVPAGSSGTSTVYVKGACKVIDMHFIKLGSTGGGSDTVTLTDGTYAISDALALNSKAAKAIVRMATIDTNYTTLAAGARLVANYTCGTTSCEGTMYVRAIKV